MARLKEKIAYALGFCLRPQPLTDPTITPFT